MIEEFVLGLAYQDSVCQPLTPRLLHLAIDVETTVVSHFSHLPAEHSAVIASIDSEVSQFDWRHRFDNG